MCILPVEIRHFACHVDQSKTMFQWEDCSLYNWFVFLPVRCMWWCYDNTLVDWYTSIANRWSYHTLVYVTWGSCYIDTMCDTSLYKCYDNIHSLRTIITAFGDAQKCSLRLPCNVSCPLVGHWLIDRRKALIDNIY